MGSTSSKVIGGDIRQSFGSAPHLDRVPYESKGESRQPALNPRFNTFRMLSRTKISSNVPTCWEQRTLNRAASK